MERSMTLALPRLLLAGSLLLIGCIPSNASVISLTHPSVLQSRTYRWLCDSNCSVAGDGGRSLSVGLDYFSLNGIPEPLDGKIGAESTGGSLGGAIMGPQNPVNVAYALGAFNDSLLNEPVIKGPASVEIRDWYVRAVSQHHDDVAVAHSVNCPVAGSDACTAGTDKC